MVEKKEEKPLLEEITGEQFHLGLLKAIRLYEQGINASQDKIDQINNVREIVEYYEQRDYTIKYVYNTQTCSFSYEIKSPEHYINIGFRIPKEGYS